MKWVVIETTEHLVVADTHEEALELFDRYGPDGAKPPVVTFVAVIERSVEEAIIHA